jgi:hypothetical protein
MSDKEYIDGRRADTTTYVSADFRTDAEMHSICDCESYGLCAYCFNTAFSLNILRAIEVIRFSASELGNKTFASLSVYLCSMEFVK